VKVRIEVEFPDLSEDELEKIEEAIIYAVMNLENEIIAGTHGITIRGVRFS